MVIGYPKLLAGRRGAFPSVATTILTTPASVHSRRLSLSSTGYNNSKPRCLTARRIQPLASAPDSAAEADESPHVVH